MLSLWHLANSYSIDISRRSALFLKGNGGTVDLGERRGKRVLRGVEEGKAAVRMHFVKRRINKKKRRNFKSKVKLVTPSLVDLI